MSAATAYPANATDARTRGSADGTFGRKIVLRGLEQLAFIALCGLTLLGCIR